MSEDLYFPVRLWEANLLPECAVQTRVATAIGPNPPTHPCHTLPALTPHSLVRVKISGRTVTVFGPRGSLTKTFDHVKINLFFVNHGKTIRTSLAR
jgi:hypothetical protein